MRIPNALHPKSCPDATFAYEPGPEPVDDDGDGDDDDPLQTPKSSVNSPSTSTHMALRHFGAWQTGGRSIMKSPSFLFQMQLSPDRPDRTARPHATTSRSRRIFLSRW